MEQQLRRSTKCRPTRALVHKKARCPYIRIQESLNVHRAFLRLESCCSIANWGQHRDTPGWGTLVLRQKSRVNVNETNRQSLLTAECRTDELKCAYCSVVLTDA